MTSVALVVIGIYSAIFVDNIDLLSKIKYFKINDFYKRLIDDFEYIIVIFQFPASYCKYVRLQIFDFQLVPQKQKANLQFQSNIINNTSHIVFIFFIKIILNLLTYILSFFQLTKLHLLRP